MNARKRSNANRDRSKQVWDRSENWDHSDPSWINLIVEMVPWCSHNTERRLEIVFKSFRFYTDPFQSRCGPADATLRNFILRNLKAELRQTGNGNAIRLHSFGKRIQNLIFPLETTDNYWLLYRIAYLNSLANFMIKSLRGNRISAVLKSVLSNAY